MNNNPQKLTRQEWDEIAKVKEVRQVWGMETKKDVENWRGSAFAVKFNYISDGPGYVGDLFLILGGEPECPPVVLARYAKGGGLAVVDQRDY